MIYHPKSEAELGVSSPDLSPPFFHAAVSVETNLWLPFRFGQ